MINVRKILIFLSYLLFVSCQKLDNKEMICFLTNRDTKYWTQVLGYPHHWLIGVSYNVNGKILVYSNLDNGKRIKIDSAGWVLSKDSVITYTSGIKVKIIYINKDVMILNTLDSNNLNQAIMTVGVNTMIRSDDQSTIPIRDTTQEPSTNL